MKPGPNAVDDTPSGQQRLDKWLWFARILRTRAAAAELARKGRVRVNGVRAASAARAIRAGDILTIQTRERVLVLKVEELGCRRESYSLARLLYNDLSQNAHCDSSDGASADLRGSNKGASKPADLANPRAAQRGRLRPSDPAPGDRS